jgi:hypothetical protein
MAKSKVVSNSPASATSAFVIEVGAGALPIDEGALSARIASVLDLGVQPPMAGGKSTSPRRQLAIGFELNNATAGGIALDPPPTMYRRYNVVYGPKAELPKLLRALLARDPAPGEKLSPASWIGKPVLCVIEHTVRPDGGQSARISSVSRSSGEGVPKLFADPLVYPGCQMASLPDWAVSAIGAQLTAVAAAPQAASGYDDLDSDVPQ